jgi:hypothetical protein
VEGWLRRTLADPNIDQHLLHDDGEVVVDEVLKHWVVYLLPLAELLLALVFVGVGVFVPIAILWLPWGVALAIAGHAGWSAMSAYMDRFVITNLRVFRVRGVLGRRMATMPLGRILDITVHRPLIGRILGYGHFVFESVAQAQGLRDVRFVGRPEERDLAIQRVVQRAGLRGSPRLY